MNRLQPAGPDWVIAALLLLALSLTVVMWAIVVGVAQ